MLVWQFPCGWFSTVVLVATFDGISMAFAPLEVTRPFSEPSLKVPSLNTQCHPDGLLQATGVVSFVSDTYIYYVDLINLITAPVP